MRTPVPGTLKLTRAQRRSFDDDGFFLVEHALTAAEIETLIAVTDVFADAGRRARGLPGHAPIRVNNIAARHPAYRSLLDHATTLPLIVDVIGTRIHLRGSNLDVRPPIPAEERAVDPDPADFARHWHRDEPQGGWPTVNGVPPFLELKVGFYLTDLTRPGAGALRIVPGSHRLADDAIPADPPDVVECAVAAGTAVVFRTSLMHDVAPNHGEHVRKCLYFAYQHRWLRPSDYVSVPEEVLAACSPVQRQLLGGFSDPTTMVKDRDVEPCSTYWTPLRADLPLQDWAQRHGLDPEQSVNHDVRAR